MDETYGKLKKLKVNKRSTSGYVLSLTMVFEKGERTIEKENEIRYALGKYLLDLDLADGTNKHRASSVPSACFEIKSQKKGTLVLTGGGFGHGIGRNGRKFSDFILRMLHLPMSLILTHKRRLW